MATELSTGRTATNLAEIPEAVLEKRYGTTRAEVQAIKTALAPEGTTDFEMMLYLGVCKRLGLDPFVPRLVHFARFPKKDADGKFVGWRTGIILGVYGYLQMAQQQTDCDGLAVKCYPEDMNANPTHATCTIWKKNWSHPLEVSVTFKEKNQPTSKFWKESPRQALETAVIRRACRLCWPALFAPMDDEDVDDSVPPEARGRVGTVLGDHHDAPIAEVRVVEPSLAPAPVPATVPGRAVMLEPPAAAPAAHTVDENNLAHLETLKAEVRAVLEANDRTTIGWRMNRLFDERLDSANLKHLNEATVAHAPFLETLISNLKMLERQR